METPPPFFNGDPDLLAKEAEEKKNNLSAGLKVIELARARAIENEAKEAEKIRHLTTNELPATAEQYKNAKEGRVPPAPLAELTSKNSKPKPKEPWWVK